VEVSDAGPGIPPEHLGHLFERFYRVDRSRSSGSGGSGLGLAVVDAVARAHGGAVSVASEPGRGTTFALDLPA
ncbi:MAG: sensor histidine kinase, partial [Micrococcales bacterium]|nr:sensor histidine kinase [Micrococcales bacterium]